MAKGAKRCAREYSATAKGYLATHCNAKQLESFEAAQAAA